MRDPKAEIEKTLDRAGNYDALTCAQEYGAFATDLRAKLDKSHPIRRGAWKILLAKDMRRLPLKPKPGEDFPSQAKDFWYRVQMNLTPNSLGMRLRNSQLPAILDQQERTQTQLRLLRAVIRLQIGESIHDIVDPYSGKDFHVDPKRKVIYSVGENGMDELGSYDDIVYRYQKR